MFTVSFLFFLEFRLLSVLFEVLSSVGSSPPVLSPEGIAVSFFLVVIPVLVSCASSLDNAL